MNLLLLIKKVTRAQQGASLVEVAIILPVLVVLIAAILDVGSAYYDSIALARAAEAGALYGSQNPTDTTGMVSAANDDVQNVNGVTSTAVYGCECSDGSSQSASCSTSPSSCPSGTNQVYYVTVTSSATYTPRIPWPGIPSTYHLASTVTMRSGG